MNIKYIKNDLLSISFDPENVDFCSTEWKSIVYAF